MPFGDEGAHEFVRFNPRIPVYVIICPLDSQTCFRREASGEIFIVVETNSRLI